MANIILGFPNRIDSATITGGAWAKGLPVTNLQELVLSQVARTVDLTPASATFTLDLGNPRAIRILALINHTITLSGRLRMEASMRADFADHALDITVDAWGGLAKVVWDIASLEWESSNYWLGGYTQEDVESQTAISSHVLERAIVATHWRVTVIDPDNPAGYIQIGRVFVGDGFVDPQVNYDYGASLGYEDATGVDTALSGTEYFDVREPVRVMRIQLSRLSHDEGFAKALELTRRAGVHREIFVVADPDDGQFGAQRNFMGRLRQLSPLEQAVYAHTSMSFEIKELR